MNAGSRRTPNVTSKEKKDCYYALTMFPYPSWYGLHVWHASVFTINDIVARYQRMLWKEVLNPIWFDSFWLPTENYAMKLGKPTYEVTKDNIQTFLKQIDALQLSFDQSSIFATSDASYYKRTQRIFQELYKAWLVYRDELWVNRCPDCQTVLANDQVVEWTCERCKSEIIQKKMPQWFIKITDYADRLIEDLDTIDRPEETKTAQKNWIGKSQWAEIHFDVSWKTVTVFTTRPDTLYGVTALVLAPENTLLDTLLKNDAVLEYRKETMSKTAVERQKNAKEKTWVDSWLVAKHPLTWEMIPVRYADYVLPDYATWSVMMVPAHDQRDYEFASKFWIPSMEVIQWEKEEWSDVVRLWTVINSWQFDWMKYPESKDAIIDFIEEKNVWTRKITYKLRDWSVSRQRYWGSPIPFYYKPNQNPLIPFQKRNWWIWNFHEGEPIMKRDTVMAVLHDPKADKYAVISWLWLWVDNFTFVLWWVDEWELPVDAAKREIIEETWYKNVSLTKHLWSFQTEFWHAVKKRNQHNCTECYLFELVNDENDGHNQEDNENLEVVWMSKEELFWLEQQEPLRDYYLKLACWEDIDRTWDTIHKYNKRNIAKPDVSKPELVPQEELPVVLPLDIQNYKPKGKSPLEEHDSFPIYKKWTKALLIHWWGNHPTDDPGCLLWVKETLEAQWIEVYFPRLTYHEDYDFAKAMSDINDYDADIVVGHSTWWYLALHYATKYWCPHVITLASTIDQEHMSEDLKAWAKESFWDNAQKVLNFQKTSIDYDALANTKIMMYFGELDTIVDNYYSEKFAWLISHADIKILDMVWHMWSTEKSLSIETINHYIKTLPTHMHYFRECDTLDTFMCSSFYFLRFPDAHNDDELINKEIANKLLPVDFYSWWKEHTVGHLLYSRFVHKFLSDQWYLDSPEPFKRLVHQWMILGADWRKMSKRRWNVIDPLDVVEKYWSDAVRTYLMFMWPVEQDKVWNDNALKWMKKFLDRVEKILELRKDFAWDKVQEIISKYHETIQWMTYDLDNMKFNTAVSKIMIFVNAIYELECCPKEVLEWLAMFLSPFAPSLADKIRNTLWHKTDIAFVSRPVADESKIVQSTINLPVQINWKMRWNIDITPWSDETTVLELIKNVENVVKYIEWKEFKKVIYIQDRILNIIV